eukprot:TRINITY_DN53670_c0_g1_i1.p1 TRINITY_DN53670_c0_g1~~TRINITY_DN53670_c0_g1_i1.p1  ORF type:complete len:103 (+),score=4.86 TRINITY_DN53670_c0_g1_i1:279-587(+)
MIKVDVRAGKITKDQSNEQYFPANGIRGSITDHTDVKPEQICVQRKYRGRPYLERQAQVRNEFCAGGGSWPDPPSLLYLASTAAIYTVGSTFPNQIRSFLLL